ncbi:MAG: PilZ domain-containing protein [SAR86 cluster bacterium]|uniref:PilZ domain-containing protein n=1 Tax=SAR86 cluster bacterium TaxID=2030880 RepID=A0A972VV13_9GAMM|nr:PilZ domain-containing protein [SAR86 cluster bacterium]
MTSSQLIAKITSLISFRQTQRQATTASPHQQQRREIRQTNLKTLFIQIMDCPDPDMINLTLSCNTRETSASGLRIVAGTCIPIGSRLDLWVNISARPSKYFVTGEVRWVSPADGGDYDMGIELDTSVATDIDAWRAFHA